MSSEVRIVRGAAIACVVATPVAAGVAWALRGSDAAASVSVAAGIVLVNAALAAALSALGGRFGPTGPAMMALPSFGLRLALVFGILGALRSATFVDRPAFAAGFVLALVGILAMEARAWARTPWLALTFARRAGEGER